MLLLTGSTGYLGSQIARALIARGGPFRILVREPARLGFDPAAVRCEVIAGDLRDPSALRRSLAGAEAVIHTAALVKMWVRDRRDFWRINVEGLQNLLQAAANCGVKKVVYTSSFIALGPSPDSSAAESLSPSGDGSGDRRTGRPGRFSNEYEESKAKALEWVRSVGTKQFPVVTLMPGVIYGPGPRTAGNLVGGMIEQYLAGKFPGLLGSGEQRWSFAFNEEVVGAHLAALERGKPGDEFVLAGDNRSLNDFFRLLAELTGVRHKVRHLPFVAGKIAGALGVALANLTGRPPQLTPGVVEIFKHDWVYSSAKAIKELGYRVTPLEEGLKKTLEALKNGVIF